MKAEPGAAAAFLIPFVVAVAARALLVTVVLLLEPGCDLASFASAADGHQVLAMADAWRGDLTAVREAEFFKILDASDGLGSSYAIRFFMAPAVIAAGQAAGLPTPVAATVPFWIFAAMAAGLTGVWLRDWRAGVLVAAMPPILLYSTSFSDATGWLMALGVAALIAARGEHWTAAGAAGALACWARPEGVFVLAASALACRRGRAPLARLLLGAVVVAAMGIVAVAARIGPLVSQVFHGKAGTGVHWPGFLDLPGAALVRGLVSASTPAWKVPYVGAHLALLVGACWLLLRRVKATSSGGRQVERREAEILLGWAALQLALVLCLAGTQGFDDLPRYASLCFPAIVAAYLPLLPRSPVVIAAACAASLAVATVPARKNTRAECPSEGVQRPSAPHSIDTTAPP